MFVDENKRSLISSFCSSTSIYTLHQCHLGLKRLVANRPLCVCNDSKLSRMYKVYQLSNRVEVYTKIKLVLFGVFVLETTLLKVITFALFTNPVLFGKLFGTFLQVPEKIVFLVTWD